mmetsp:Transcript_40239/g.61845  ORF Transcript_40239/g.61845 Transcript_40239/m.61845 type:complete len:838 (-) Transcript_40239:171-2684(-)
MTHRMKRKSAEEPQPDLEAHFSDGAWYDIILLASDPSRDRFLVQAKDFPDEQEWVDSTVIRPQSQPFEKPPAVGSTVLALHRSQRSDLFFEGLVKELSNGSHCRIQFTEGRVRGQTIKVPLDDVNRICTRKLSLQVLKSWCTSSKPARAASSVQIVEFKKGEFVLIEGPDEGFWVAQLMEPYTGRISEEVDDVDDDGPTVKLRWLYKPSELPKNLCKGHEIDKKHEVLVSFHKDAIDARLIVRKCKVSFGVDRPRKDRVFEEDELFSCRTWDPTKRRITSFDCPSIPTEFKKEIKELMALYPLKRPRGHTRSGDSSPEESSKIRLDDSSEITNRFWAEGNDEMSDAELAGGKADAQEVSEARNDTETPVGIADGVKRRSRSPVSLVASLSGEKENGSKRTKEGKSHDLATVGVIKTENRDSVSPRNCIQEFGVRKKKRNGSPAEALDRSHTKSPVVGQLSGSKRRSASPLEESMEARSRSKTPCNSGLVASRSPTEPMSRSAEEERELLDSAHREGADLDLATNGDVAKRLAGTVENKDRDEAEWSLAETDQLPSAKKEGCDDEDAVDEDSAGEGVEDVIEMVGDEPTTIDSRDEELEATEGGVVMKAIAVLVNEEGEEEDTHPADSTGEHGYDVSTSGSPECGSTDLSHDHAGYPITALGVADESRDEDDGDFCTVGEHNWITCDFMDCKLTSDLAAVEGFIIEAVRYSSTLFLKQQQFSSVVYFLHRRRGKRELSSVGISACFKSARAHKKCQKFLRAYAREKKAIAAILVAEDHNVKHPRWAQRGNAGAKYSDGLFVQLDSHHRRGMWHIVPGMSSDCTFTKLDASQSIVRRLV